jgi:2-polyprenyl-3-methyl-5-hydroxy-6-metoxy-1,4-benzoquinol methylase
MSEESARLDGIAGDSRYSAGVNFDTIHYSFRIFRRFFKGSSILEMGPAEGVMTQLLAETGFELSVVEGAEAFCESLRRRFPAIRVHHSLFETFAPGRSYDNIVLGHVLEHVDDPVAILKAASAWLAPGGRILTAVPNCRSLHRQAAVLMGLLPIENALNDADRHHGHRRVFDPESFRAIFRDAGLATEIFGGYWMKPVSNAQIERDWTPQMLEAFMQLGERYPDIAGEIYCVATHPS